MTCAHWQHATADGHSLHHHWRLRFWRLQVHAEAWTNRYPTTTPRVCVRLGGFYDRKHGKGYA